MGKEQLEEIISRQETEILALKNRVREVTKENKMLKTYFIVSTSGIGR